MLKIAANVAAMKWCNTNVGRSRDVWKGGQNKLDQFR